MTISAQIPAQDGLQQALGLLMQLVATNPETDQLLAEMVRLSGQALQAGGAGVWVTENPDAPALVLEQNLVALGLLVNGGPLAGLNVAVRRTVRENKPLIVPAFFVDNEANDLPVNPSAFELLFVPMRLHGKVAMVLVMAVPATNDTNVRRVQITFLQRALGAVETALAQRHINLMEKDRGTASKMVEFAQRVHAHLFLNQVAVDIANLMRDVIGADRVTAELYPRFRKKIVAVSNVDEPNKRAALFQAQRLILEYVRDRNVPVALDREAAKQLVSDPMLQDAAQAYFMISNMGAFLAAPVRQAGGSGGGGGERVIGVVLAEYAESKPAQEHATLLSDLARICGTSVSNALTYEAIPLRRTLHAVSEFFKKATSTKRYVAYTVAAVLTVVLTLLCVVPFDFALKADCTVQPVALLNIVAPMEGRIIEVGIHAGEHVYAKKDLERLGDKVKPLLVFDTTDLLAARAEQQQKEAELNVQLKELQNTGEISKIGAAALQLKQVADQIKLLNHQIEQAKVYSPIEGTVLTENPEQKKWASVRLGEPLLDVASFSDWVLIVEVPESEVATVRDALYQSGQRAINKGVKDAGVEVEYIFYPWPDKRYSIHAVGFGTLLPASSQSKNANVFRLQIPVNPAGLPPGIAMSGVTGRAKIHVGRKALMIQWTRGVNQLLKMTAFF